MTGLTEASFSGHSVFVVSAGIPTDSTESLASYSPFVIFVMIAKASSATSDLALIAKNLGAEVRSVKTRRAVRNFRISEAAPIEIVAG